MLFRSVAHHLQHYPRVADVCATLLMTPKARVATFLAMACCTLTLQSFFAATFVSAPRSGVTSLVQNEVAQTAAVPVFTALLVPGVAEAATQEQQLNRFGFGFAIFFLAFFVAGLFRIFSKGKL